MPGCGVWLGGGRRKQAAPRERKELEGSKIRCRSGTEYRPQWALTDSNRRPLPCKGEAYIPLTCGFWSKALVENEIAAHCFSSVRMISHHVADYSRTAPSTRQNST